MKNADILVKISPILETFNTRQKMIAGQLLSDSKYSFLDYQGEICILNDKGELFNFVRFVKSKCNCD